MDCRSIIIDSSARLQRKRLPSRAVLAWSLLLLPLLIATMAVRAGAQSQTPRESLLINSKSASTWSEGQTVIIELKNPVVIDLDRTHMTAQSAVVWLTPVKGSVLEEQKLEIALIGGATLSEGNLITRSGQTLFVTAVVRGTVRLTAQQRTVENLDKSELYQHAMTFRPAPPSASQPTTVDPWLIQRPWMSSLATSQPTTSPTTKPSEPIGFKYDLMDVQNSPATGGLITIILSGNVTLLQTKATGEVLELRADRAVLFTSLKSLRESGNKERFARIEDAITGAYLEGDVRIEHTPADTDKGGEQRLTASRVFYDFTTDRAVLTTAVLHTMDPTTLQPFIVRAQTIHQLSEGEYTVDKAQLTTSSFALPSYSIGVDKAYIRQIDTGDPRYGVDSQFVAKGVTFQAYGKPLFYLPSLSGDQTEKGAILRGFQIRSGDPFGEGLVTQWGLFETLGQIPPADTDITYEADYLSERGPAAGLAGHYAGGFVTDTDKEPWAFDGVFKSLFVEDHGQDDLSRNRALVNPDTQQRYRFEWDHQHYFPDDWQVQITTTLLSDPTFLEQWYPDSFYNEGPHDTALYVKHQQDTEALTFLVSVQPNNFVTSADLAQEQFEVERLPEIGYHRTGDDVANGNMTFFSDDSVTGLRFHRSDYTLAQQGYLPTQTPGLPSLGYTGTVSSITYRGDFRQEVDYPFTFGQFRVVPYVVGRYTPYSNSPGGDDQNRLYGGAGLRLTTAFWKVDDSVESELFDLHRLRHVIEPSINLFAGAQNVSRSNLFIYDEDVDAINDIQAVQFALNQRWQTKRGGANEWRSVDVFTLNVEANLYAHKPPASQLNPLSFRGLFFDSMPETSIPRDSLNADFTWRISDTTTLLADEEFNIDQTTLATASVGFAVRRDERLSYFVGTRYIQAFNSNIATVAANYELTSKYTLAVSQSFDIGQEHNVSSGISITRHFDRFYASLDLRYDASSGQSGFMIDVYPEGFGRADVSTGSLRSVFSQ